MTTVNLSCECGQVQGQLSDAGASTGTRIHCCCNDCQSFARYLGKPDSVLDQYGATDIFQMPMARLNIHAGSDSVACVRLSEKGLHRWFASCCNTPIGNTLGASMPFVGVIHNFVSATTSRDSDLGPTRGYIQIKSALKTVPAELRASRWVLPRSISRVLRWKIRGLNKPSAFFDAAGQPRSMPVVLDNKP